MKIAIIGQKGMPSKSGGVEKHVEDLATRLVKKGHEVLVYTRPNYTPKDLQDYKGVKLVSLPTIGTKHLDAIVHTFLACLDLVKRDVDVIHFQSIGPASLIWLVKLLKPKTPIIATFHCKCYNQKKWGFLAQAYLHFGELVICRLADKTIITSKTLAKYAEEKYKRPVEYISTGVSLPANVSEASSIKTFNLEKDNYILALSRLVKHKGLQYLVEAFKKIKTDKKLVIVGGGAYTDEFVKELKSLAADDKRIIFTGIQSGAIIDELYSNAYLFVQPSESEGLSIALLEAMANGCATLVSDITENKEAIGNTGATFKNKNVADLQEKLEFLLDHPEAISAMGAEAKARAEQEYDVDKIINQIEEVYNNVLAEAKVEANNLSPIKVVSK